MISARILQHGCCLTRFSSKQANTDEGFWCTWWSVNCTADVSARMTTSVVPHQKVRGDFDLFMLGEAFVGRSARWWCVCRYPSRFVTSMGSRRAEMRPGPMCWTSPASVLLLPPSESISSTDRAIMTYFTLSPFDRSQSKTYLVLHR